MLSNDNNLDKDRFYEVTDVADGDVWKEPVGSRYCINGVIVQPGQYKGMFKVIQSARSGYLKVSGWGLDDQLHLGTGLTLRPLNKKDQAKLERIRSQFCA